VDEHVELCEHCEAGELDCALAVAVCCEIATRRAVLCFSDHDVEVDRGVPVGVQEKHENKAPRLSQR
jgi:hypothetical protein